VKALAKEPAMSHDNVAVARSPAAAPHPTHVPHQVPHHVSRSAAIDPTHAAAVSEALKNAFGPALIDPATTWRLAQIAISHRFAAQAPVLKRDSDNAALWLVGRGRVSVGSHDPQGHWRQARAVDGGEWLDVASAWLGGPFFEEAIAATEATVYELPLDEVQALCDERPALARLLIQVMAERVRQTTDTARELAVKDVPSRLAGWLLDHMPAASPEGRRVKLNQHKRVLASELGTSPETFSRALARLRLLGCIAVKGYAVDVLDVNGLCQLAGRPAAADTGRRPTA
jgi:CRP-like cAMP-binding protein